MTNLTNAQLDDLIEAADTLYDKSGTKPGNYEHYHLFCEMLYNEWYLKNDYNAKVIDNRCIEKSQNEWDDTHNG